MSLCVVIKLQLVLLVYWLSKLNILLTAVNQVTALELTYEVATYSVEQHCSTASQMNSPTLTWSCSKCCYICNTCVVVTQSVVHVQWTLSIPDRKLGRVVIKGGVLISGVVLSIIPPTILVGINVEGAVIHVCVYSFGTLPLCKVVRVTCAHFIH